MKVIFELINWVVLAVIVAAIGFGDAFSGRFIGAASVWIGFWNALALVLACALVFSSKARDTYRERWAKRSWTFRSYFTLTTIVEMAVFAYVGWLWSFGIRLSFLFATKTAAMNPGKEAV